MPWKKDLKKDQVFVFKGTSKSTVVPNIKVQAKNVNVPLKPLSQQNYTTGVPTNRPMTRSRTNQTQSLKEKPKVKNADELLISKVKNMKVRDGERKIKKENKLPLDNRKNPLQKV